MPVPDSSDYTRQTRLLTIISAQGTSRNNVTYYVPPLTSAGADFFLPKIYSLPPAPSIPTYTLSQTATSIDEGQSVVITLTTTNVPDGSFLYWTTSGTSIAADFTDNALSGSLAITSGLGTLTRTLTPDALTDPDKTFVLDIRTGSLTGPIVASSTPITIVDTTPAYAIDPSVSSVNEGEAVVFNVTTTNVADGTLLYWTNSGTTLAEDFSDNANSGSVNVNSGTAAITRTLLLDAIASETETVILQLRTESVSGTIVATSGTVSVIDKTAVYAAAASTTTLDEGQSVTFTLTTANVADGTTLYWTTSGTATATDFTDDASSGSFTITSGTGTIIRSIKNDVISEGTETFTLSVRTTSISGTIVATSSTITINDTSRGSTFAFTSSPTPVAFAEVKMSDDGTTIITSTNSGFAVIASGSFVGPYVSVDGGSTWNQARTGLPLNTDATSVTIARLSPNIMYTVVTGNSTDSIWKSINYGQTWTAITPSATAGKVVCSDDGNIVLATNNGSSAPADYANVIVSTDGGSSWTKQTFFANNIYSSPAISGDGGTMYVARSFGGIFKWTSATGWAAISGITNDTHAPLYCSRDGTIVIAARTSTNPLLITPSGKSTIGTGVFSQGAKRSVLSMSRDGNTIFGATSTAGTVISSANRGATWITYPPFTFDNPIYCSDMDYAGSKVVMYTLNALGPLQYVGTR